MYLSFFNHDSFSVQELQGKSKQWTGQKWQERSACWTWNRWKFNFVSIKVNLLIEFRWIIFGLKLTFWLMSHPFHKTGLRGSDPADQSLLSQSSIPLSCCKSSLLCLLSTTAGVLRWGSLRTKKLLAQTSSKDHSAMEPEGREAFLAFAVRFVTSPQAPLFGFHPFSLHSAISISASESFGPQTSIAHHLRPRKLSSWT